MAHSGAVVRYDEAIVSEVERQRHLLEETLTDLQSQSFVESLQSCHSSSEDNFISMEHWDDIDGATIWCGKLGERVPHTAGELLSDSSPLMWHCLKKLPLKKEFWVDVTEDDWSGRVDELLAQLSAASRARAESLMDQQWTLSSCTLLGPVADAQRAKRACYMAIGAGNNKTTKLRTARLVLVAVLIRAEHLQTHRAEQYKLCQLICKWPSQSPPMALEDEQSHDPEGMPDDQEDDAEGMPDDQEDDAEGMPDDPIYDAEDMPYDQEDDAEGMPEDQEGDAEDQEDDAEGMKSWWESENWAENWVQGKKRGKGKGGKVKKGKVHVALKGGKVKKGKGGRVTKGKKRGKGKKGKDQSIPAPPGFPPPQHLRHGAPTTASAPEWVSDNDWDCWLEDDAEDKRPPWRR